MNSYAPAMRLAIEKLRQEIRLLQELDSPSKGNSRIWNDRDTSVLKRNNDGVAASETNQVNHSLNKTLLIVLGTVGSALFILGVMLLIYCVIRRRTRIKFKSSNEDLLSDFFNHRDNSKSLNSVNFSTKDDNDSNVLDFILPQPPPRRKTLSRKSICGRLNPELYPQASSTGETYSSGLDGGSGLGTIEFSVVYERETDNLIVAVLRVCSLPERILDDNRTALRNPFVRVLLLPDQLTHQTKVCKGTLNPLFNECVVFTIDPQYLPQKRLHLSVYDHDKKAMRHSLGHVLIPLESIDLEEEVFYRLYLERLEEVLHSHLGDMELSITYIPDASKIKIGVLNCKDFNEFSKDVEQAVKCQVYIRVQLYRGKRLERTKETNTASLGPDIFFNEFMNFSVPLRYIDESHFLFTAVLKTDRDPGVSVGRVELGPYKYARGEELMHWQQAIDKPRATITMFHMIDSPEVSGKGKSI